MTESYEMLSNIELDNFERSLNEELNNEVPLSTEELLEQLKFIINDYEQLFYNDYSNIYIYFYYKNLLNNKVLDKIIDFVQNKKPLDNTGKEEILKAERKEAANILYLFGMQREHNYFISQITGKQIPINYKAEEIINNNDVFFRPPSGDPTLRGPHINSTIEYSMDYWVKFKDNINNYIAEFEKVYGEDFLEDLKDYRYWLNKYRIYTLIINLNKERKENHHVKN